MKILQASEWDENGGLHQCMKAGGIISDVFFAGKTGVFLQPEESERLRNWVLTRLKSKIE